MRLSVFCQLFMPQWPTGCLTHVPPIFFTVIPFILKKGRNSHTKDSHICSWTSQLSQNHGISAGLRHTLLSYSVPKEARLWRNEEIPGVFSGFSLSREGLHICSVLTSSSHHPTAGTYLWHLHSAFLEGACVGVMGANMPVFTPVAAVWALHTGQTSEHREEAHILELQPKHPCL